MTLSVGDSAIVDGEVFAKLVGRYPADDMLLFQVSESLVDQAREKWSPLCRVRFVREPDTGLYYMEMFTIHDVAPDEQQ